TLFINFFPVSQQCQTGEVPFNFSFNNTFQQHVVNICLGQALPVHSTPNPDVYLGLVSVFSGQAENSDGTGGQTITADLFAIGGGGGSNSTGSLERYLFGSHRP